MQLFYFICQHCLSNCLCLFAIYMDDGGERQEVDYKGVHSRLSTMPGHLHVLHTLNSLQNREVVVVMNVDNGDNDDYDEEEEE